MGHFPRHGNPGNLMRADTTSESGRIPRHPDTARRRRIGLAGTALLCVLLFVAPAFSLDIPPYDGPVNDPAGALDRRAVQELSSSILQYREASGIEIGVLILESLEEAPLEDYARDVFQAWGIGQKDRDNGALFLAAVNDRKARIEVGYGLESALTDLECGRIVARQSPMADAFRGGDYAGGIAAVIDGIKAGIAGDYEPPASTASGAGVPGPLLVFVIVMIVIVMFRLRDRAQFGAPGSFRHGSFGGFAGGSSGRGSGGGFSFGGGSSGGGGASGGW